MTRMLPSHTAAARSRRGARRSLAAAALAVLTLLPIAVLSGAGDASAAAQRQPRRTDDFVIATFNVLGRSDTDGHDRRRGGFDNSSTRMTRTLEVLRRSSIDVVGFQELQRQQLEQFRSRTNGAWGVFSGSRTDSDNTVAWRRDQFSLVRGWSVPIPYFHGNRREMPVVELESRSSGQRMFVMNVHNPADARGKAARWRRIAVAKERQVTSRLTRREDAPVFLTGDMNDRAPFFCQMTRNGVMHAAVGGSHSDGRCHAPESGIDWVLGNQLVSFRSHRVDHSRLVSATTDHPVVSAHVRVR